MGSLPDWFDSRSTNNERSRKQERKRARETGGRTRAGSGSSWRAPQDNRTESTLEQIKFTDNKSFTLKVSELKKVRKDALEAGREPTMLVDFERHGIRVSITIEEL